MVVTLALVSTPMPYLPTDFMVLDLMVFLTFEPLKIKIPFDFELEILLLLIVVAPAPSTSIPYLPADFIVFELIEEADDLVFT